MERIVTIRIDSSRVKHTLIRFNIGVTFREVLENYLLSSVMKKEFYDIESISDIGLVWVKGERVSEFQLDSVPDEKFYKRNEVWFSLCVDFFSRCLF